MLEAIIRNLKEITFREWEWQCSTYDIQVANVSIGAYAEQGMLGETKELVPGDIVEPKVGDKGAADICVVEFISSTLRVEQGSLTGESEAVNKTNKPISEDTDIQGKKSTVFAGPIVVNGNCLCLVAETGMSTEIGKVHMQIHVASQSEEDTPLKEKFNEFGEILKMITGVICVLVWFIHVKYFLTWDDKTGTITTNQMVVANL